MSRSPHATARVALPIVLVVLLAIAAVAVGVLVQSFAPTARGEAIAPSTPASESGGPISPFDDDDPAIANLRPELRTALQQAAQAAAGAGFDLVVNSGWRTAEEQARLFEEAVVTYGSREKAARWVAPPETSSHVSGEAVDVGDLDASIWLGDNGRDFGLCRTYSNERWHFEFRAEAIGADCPEPYLDASDDPRLRQTAG